MLNRVFGYLIWRHQTLRHFIEVLKQLRINLLIGLGDWIVSVYNIEVYITVVGVHHNLNRISDIIGLSDFIAVRLRVRIVRACGISVQHPVNLSVCNDRIRVVFVTQIRHNLPHTLCNISVDDDAGVALDVGGYQNLGALLSDSKHNPVEEIQLDTCISFILVVLVGASVRIVKLVFTGVNQYIVVGHLAEINFRLCYLNLVNRRFRRNILYQYIRLSAGGYSIYPGQSQTITVGIFQMSVQPCILNLILVDFSDGKISLGILTVYHVAVYIRIVEAVVLSDTLRLIIESVHRVVVVDTDIFDGLRIVGDILAGQRVVGREGLNGDIVYLIRVLCIFDVAFQIGRLLC